MNSASETTFETTEHTMPLALLNLMISMGIPALVGIIGIVQLGWDAISWTGAIVWGIVATVAFTAFSMMGSRMGMTRMDLLELLGSIFVSPGTPASKATGLIVHSMNGAVLAIAWAYGAALLDAPANWWTGAVWGVVLWVLALLMLTSMGAVHPAIRRGQVQDPGPAATNFGKLTPVASLLGHLVYGVVLGWLYQAFPL